MKKLSITLKSALKLNKGIIGYVYPQNEESYYLNSGIAEHLYCIECLDGYFYTTDEALFKLQKEVKKHVSIHNKKNDILCMKKQKEYDLLHADEWEELRG